MDALAIALFWALAIWGYIGRPKILIYLFFGSLSFGAFAVVPTNLTGGLTLTPSPIVALLIALKLLLRGSGPTYLLKTALSKRGPVYLTLFWLVAFIATLTLPRLFEGSVAVIPVRAEQLAFAERLHPTTQNFSQMVYLTISTLSVFAFARYQERYFEAHTFLKPIRFGAICAILTGVADYASQFVPLDAVLSPFRTATYALLTSDLVFDSKRIVGLMPEASSYGAICTYFLSLMYFLRPREAKKGFDNTAHAATTLVLIAMAILSTSSAAYATLLVFLALVAFEWLWKDVSIKRNPLSRFTIIWTALFGIVITVFVLNPAIFSNLVEIFDKMVLHKTESVSFEERAMWTTTSLQALKDTYGLGVGVGGTRPSNFLAALFSNTGVIGGMLYLLFTFRTVYRARLNPHSPPVRNLQRGLMLAFIPPFVAQVLVGTVTDFGITTAYIFGTCIALASKGIAERAQPKHHPYRVV
jgi:hypothetical protein